LRQDEIAVGLIRDFRFKETAEKEVQDTFCRGSGGVPQLQKSPKTGGYRGLIESISAISLLSRFEVIPTYRVSFLWLARM